jgi:glycosyltransferase involved in cell wall biosynthesis
LIPFVEVPRTSPKELHLKGLTFFYPTSHYAHKNLQIFSSMNASPPKGLDKKVKVFLPLNKTNTPEFLQNISWVEALGFLDPVSCMNYLRDCDALIFPSFMESFGFPLVEAMLLEKPIICTDHPYARELCGDKAVYFNPKDPQSVWEAMEKVSPKSKVNWQDQLARFPKSWDEVARRFKDTFSFR